jgi:hypothetical protein
MNEFIIAQYFRDPIRREPKNVGIIAIRDGECVGRFLGADTISGDVHLGRVPWVKEPKVYRKWVRFWKEEIARGPERIFERLAYGNKGNYGVVLGGKMTGVGVDTAIQLCDRLFDRIVAEPVELGEADEMVAQMQAKSIVELRREIKEEFNVRGILAGNVHNPVPNPVFVKQPVKGHLAPHKPSYLQRVRGHDYVMEVVNFETTKKAPAKDHAFFMAKMFDDIRAQDEASSRVAIVRATKEDLKDNAVVYALKFLKDSASDVVNWSDLDQRNEFVDARQADALAA